MIAQLPSGALPAAVIILIWSFVCLSTGLFLIWLVWVHGERKSYVAMLGAVMSLSVIASIIQQVHTIGWWNDIKTAQWENVVENVGRPELNITGASTGLDLVVFYIQYYTYNVEGMLVLFWSAELAVSVFQIRTARVHRFHANLIAKGAAVLLPVAQQILLHSDATQDSTAGYMILADFFMIASFGLGCILLIAILVKYIHARISLVTWNVRYGQQSTGNTNNSQSGLRNHAVQIQGAVPPPPQQPQRPLKSIYDRWLLLRFTIAFMALGVFELVVINFQLRAASTNTRENIPEVADLSAKRAIADFILFLPGVSAAPLTFIVFGTTRTFRDYMTKLFLPKIMQDMLIERRERRKKPSTVGTPGSGFPRYPGGPGGPGGDAQNNNNNNNVDLESGVRMHDFGAAKKDGDLEWRSNNLSKSHFRIGRRGDCVNTSDEDELPIMKPRPDSVWPNSPALCSHPP